MSTRTYEVDLDGTGENLRLRELPRSFAEARDMAQSIAERNPRWRGSVWTAIDDSGDAFSLDDDGRAT